MLRGLWFCFLLGLSVSPLGAGATPVLPPQNPEAPRFQHLSTTQGLSSSTVLCLLQDQQGFLWFGTREGLNRYDGYAITAYQHNPDSANSLSDNFVLSLCEDGQGRLWVGTLLGGLDCFEPSTATWTSYPSGRGERGPSSPEIGKIVAGRDGSLWLGTRSGLDRFDPLRGTFTACGKKGKVPLEDKVWDLAEDGEGRIWCATGRQGLIRFDPATGTCTVFAADARNPEAIRDNHLKTLLLRPDGTLWLGTFGGDLEHFDPKTGVAKHYDYLARKGANQGVLCLRMDDEGSLWFGTYQHGLVRLDPRTRKVDFFQPDPLDSQSISSREVWAILFDRTGLMWLGTDSGGVNVFNPKPRFGLLRHHPADSGSLSHNNVQCLTEDQDGNLWIGTYAGGLNRLDRKTQRMEHFNHDPAQPTSLGSSIVRSLYCDRQGVVWVGTENTLDRFDPRTRRFQHFRAEEGQPGRLQSGLVSAMFEDREGRFWVGTHSGGLHLFDRQAGTFQAFSHRAGDASSLCNDDIRALMQDREGFLWIGTLGGLARMDTQKGTFLNFQHQPGTPLSLGGDRIFGLYEEPDGSLWIASDGGGLNRLDATRTRISWFLTTQGLPSNAVYGILPDGQGHLWLSTHGGISCLDLKSRSFRNFDAGDGLGGNEFGRQAWLLTRDGVMCFGGLHGLNLFRPGVVLGRSEQSSVPPVVITSLKVFDRAIPVPAATAGLPEVQLDYRKNFLTFSFAALDFTNPARNGYLYKLEGVDPDWVKVIGRHQANYTDIAPGRHLFRVKAAGPDGIWNEAGASLRVIIVPPFWKTTWFRLLVLVGVVATAILIPRVHLRNVRLQNALLEFQVEERIKEIKVLQGLIPICASCKQIRDDQGFWHQLESYLSAHSRADFSHGICPKGVQELYPEFYDRQAGKTDDG